MRMVVKCLAIASLLACAGSCSSSTDVERSLQPAIIAGYEVPGVSSGVTTVGRTLAIEVVSFGDGCRERGEVKADVVQGTHTVEVHPRDWLTTGYDACTDILKVFLHQVTVEVGSAGQWTVKIIGHRSMVGRTSRVEPHEIVFRVEVS